MPSASQLPVSSLRVYLRLLGYLRPLIGWFVVSLLGYLIFASSQPMMAGILKYFVDGLNAGPGTTRQVLPVLGELDLIHAVPLLLVLAISWQGLGSFLGNYYLARVSLGLIDDLRRALFGSLLRLPNVYFDQNNSGHLISRITYDVTMVTGAATEAIKVVIREGLTVIFLFAYLLWMNFAYLLWMNWQLTLVMLAMLPIIGLMVTRASRKFRRQSRKIQAAMGDLTHVAAETIQGYRVVRSFGGEDYETARFHRASAENTAKQLRMVRTAASYTPALQFVTFSAMAGLLVLVLLLRGDASVGGLVAYITAAGMLPKPIRQLSEVSATIQKGLAGAESIFAQLDEVPEPDHGRVERARVSGRLDVRQLSFTYPGSERRVLSDVSFSAQPGQMVALVGRSGSGKSVRGAASRRWSVSFRASTSTTAARFCLTESRSRTTRCAICAGTSLWSRSRSSFSTIRWRATSPTVISPAHRVPRSKKRRRWPMLRSSSIVCRSITIRRSAKTACCSPAASASAWRLRVPFSRMRRC